MKYLCLILFMIISVYASNPTTVKDMKFLSNNKKEIFNIKSPFAITSNEFITPSLGLLKSNMVEYISNNNITLVCHNDNCYQSLTIPIEEIYLSKLKYRLLQLKETSNLYPGVENHIIISTGQYLDCDDIRLAVFDVKISWLENYISNLESYQTNDNTCPCFKELSNKYGVPDCNNDKIQNVRDIKPKFCNKREIVLLEPCEPLKSDNWIRKALYPEDFPCDKNYLNNYIMSAC